MNPNCHSQFGNTQLDTKVAVASSSKKILGVTRFRDMNKRHAFFGVRNQNNNQQTSIALKFKRS